LSASGAAGGQSDANPHSTERVPMVVDGVEMARVFKEDLARF